MNHLSEEHLVQILYDDTNDLQPGARDHLAGCQHCRQRMLELQRILAVLDSSSIDETAGRRAAGLASPAIEKPAALRPEADVGAAASWMRYAIAASIIFLVASLSFVAGTKYQSRMVKKNLDRGLEQMELRMTRALHDSLEKSAARSGDPQLLANMESLLASLVSDQKVLRSELQSLALNAESEILTTNRELQATQNALAQLLEYVGLPSNINP